ncbi:MAG: HAD hydrolase-like protein [Rhodospirillaceae bacterium]
MRRSMRDIFPVLFGERWDEARAIFYAHFAANHMKQLRPLLGAETLLKTLRARGVYLAVVSNKTGRFLREEVDELGWSDHFSRLVGAGDALFDKPATAPVKMALEPLGLTVGAQGIGHTWFVGDADIDMECAHAARCLPVLVGGGEGSDFTQFPPAFRFDNCTALCDLISLLSEPILQGACGAR